MQGLRAVLEAHGGKIAVALLALLVAPTATSVLLGGPGDLQVVASAPPQGDAMTVSLSEQAGLLNPCGGEARVEVLRGDFIVYSSALGRVEFDGCRGEIEIPYARFASVNGLYTVRTHHDGTTVETPIEVRKVVNWVYVRSFDQPSQERTRIDVALDAAMGQPLTSSIFASGTLVLDIAFERCEQSDLPSLNLTPQDKCNAQKQNVFHSEIPVDSKASTHVFIPWENLDSDTNDDGEPDEGWYNVTATFHNEVAKGNRNVPMDPTLFHEDPPATWFEVDRD